jgi:hypothetical protein
VPEELGARALPDVADECARRSPRQEQPFARYKARVDVSEELVCGDSRQPRQGQRSATPAFIDHMDDMC